METRANYVVIGLFTLAIVTAVFAFVFWFQNTAGSAERAYYRIVFEGPVSGLRTGGSVLFNGIRIGEVSELKLDPKRPQQVVALITVDKQVAVRADTEVGLEFQGLTGIAAVSLAGGTADRPALSGSKENPPTLTASPAATQDITGAARDMIRKVDNFVSDNQQSFRSAIDNINTFSQALARNSERIDHIAKGLANLTGGPDGKSGELNEAARVIRDLAKNLDERTAEITEGVGKFAASGTHELEMLSANAQRTLNTIDRAVENLDRNPSRLIFGGSASEPEKPAPGKKR